MPILLREGFRADVSEVELREVGPNADLGPMIANGTYPHWRS